MNNLEKSRFQEEIVSSLNPNPHGRLVLAPRLGKTKIIIDLIKRDKPQSILWVTISSELAKKDIPAEFDKWKAKKYKAKLTTCTWKSLDKMIGHYDMIILDEDQHITEKNSRTLVSKELTATNVIAMTGTSTKHRKKLDIYTSLNLEILYELTIARAVEVGILADYTINILQIPANSKELGAYSWIQSKITACNKSICTLNLDRMKLEVVGQLSGDLSLVEKPAKYGGRLFSVLGNNGNTIGYVVLTDSGELKGKISKGADQYLVTKGVLHEPYGAGLLVSRSKHLGGSKLKTRVTKELLSGLNGRIIIFSTNAEQSTEICPNTYNSKTDDAMLKAFYNKEISTLSLVNKGGTGYTFTELDHLIIVQADSDSNGHTTQKICRTLLEQPDYKANVWILCVEGTQDEVWVSKTLETFDKDKVKYVKYGVEN